MESQSTVTFNTTASWLAIFFLTQALFGTLALGSSKKDIRCPDGLDLVDVVYQNSSGSGAAVCGQTYPDLHHGPKKHIGGIRVFSFGSDGKPNQLIKESSELEVFLISRVENGLQLEQLAQYRGRWIPVFSESVGCTEKECRLQNKLCAFQPQPLFHDDAAIAEMQTHCTGENDREPLGDDLVIRLGELALAGNKSAQELFINPECKYNLNSHSIHEFKSFSAIFRELKQRNCIRDH